MDMTNNKALWPGWETVRLLGRGSFGAVWEIEREVFGHRERAAMKLISIPQSESDIDELLNDGYDEESITARFQSYLQDIVREYSLMADMKGCANIVYCDDVKYIQHDDGIGWDIYIKMELLTPMPKALGKTVTDEQAVKIGTDICSALVFCEKRNLLHRDIKPQNIFVAPDGTYKLGDFGIAKTAERTTGGTKTGTYKYMAPEVYKSLPYGGKADIYSLGLVLYWLLNERRTPFLPLPPATPSSSEEDRARARRFSGEAIPAPAHGSEGLKRIVLKACAYDPKDRYQSAEEMLHELQALNSVQSASPAPPREETTIPQSAIRPTAPLAGEPAEEATVYDPPTSVEEATVYDAPSAAEDDGTVGIFRAEKQKAAATPQSAQRPTALLAGEPREDATVAERTACTPKAPKPAPAGAAVSRPRVEKTPGGKAAPAAPVKKKLPKWLPLVAVLAVAAVLLIVLLPKGGGSKTPTAAAPATTAAPASAATPAPATDALATPVPTPTPTPWVEGDWTWSLKNGVLTISGTGNMANFAWDDQPWIKNRSSISRIVIENGITGIGKSSFSNFKGLTSVTIPDSVTSIGEFAFEWCTALTSVTIPASVTSIGDNAFIYCTHLKDISVDQKNPSYSSRDGVLFNRDQTVLLQCPTAKSGAYAIPDSVTSIRDNAFHQCGLKSVTIPDSVTAIGEGAFYSSYLTSVTIPASVRSIGSEAFDYCYYLTEISVDQNNPSYSSRDGVLFDRGQIVLIQCPGGKEGVYTVPAGVESIGNYAFESCSKLTDVTIPAGVTSIGSYAFAGCSSLASIKIPVSVTAIGEGAFASCGWLSKVYYAGSEAQWASVSIGDNDERQLKAKLIYNAN